ncbi:MAG: RagB/SusD family nutrient uptake outer membrane protein [Paludibacter sp.]
MKSNKIINLILLVLLSTSCTNMLQEEPISSLSSEIIFTNIRDANTAITGMYAGFVPYFATLTPVNGWGECGTDIMQGNTADQAQKFQKYTYTSADADVLKVWSSLYSIINRANNIIYNVPKIEGTDSEKNALIGEAMCVRAYCYMDLVQYFGGVPLRVQPTQSIEDAISKPRATERQTWTQIISDLEFSEQYLPAKASSAGRVTKWTAKGLLAKAYLTRGGYPVGNYAEEADSLWFQKAANKAYEVISQSGISLNPTTPGSATAFKQYGKMFLESGKNSAESLWEIQFKDPDYGSAFGWRGINGGGTNGMDITSNGTYYYQWGGSFLGSDFALSFNDDDIRFQWSVGPYKTTLSGGTTTRTAIALNAWAPAKYRWERLPANVWNSAVNYIALRMADIYLIYAEASNEATGDPNSSTLGTSAYGAINMVRSRAQVSAMDDAYLMKNSPYTTTDLMHNISFQSFDKTNTNYDKRHVYYTGTLKERFRAAVLMERAWELVGERHRWFDLKRTGKLVEFCKNTHTFASGGILTATAVADPVDKSNFTSLIKTTMLSPTSIWSAAVISEHQQYMPIPDTEININPAIGKENQNPGY